VRKLNDFSIKPPPDPTTSADSSPSLKGRGSLGHFIYWGPGGAEKLPWSDSELRKRARETGIASFGPWADDAGGGPGNAWADSRIFLHLKCRHPEIKEFDEYRAAKRLDEGASEGEKIALDIWLRQLPRAIYFFIRNCLPKALNLFQESG